MGEEAVEKKTGVGSESRDCFNVSKEKQLSKDEEPAERGDDAEPLSVKFSTGAKPSFANAGEAQAKTCQVFARSCQ